MPQWNMGLVLIGVVLCARTTFGIRVSGSG